MARRSNLSRFCSRNFSSSGSILMVLEVVLVSLSAAMVGVWIFDFCKVSVDFVISNFVARGGNSLHKRNLAQNTEHTTYRARHIDHHRP